MKRTGLDWNAVRERLVRSQQALEQALSPDAAQVDAAWRRRAVELATRGSVHERHATVPFLVFRLGPERYALDLRSLAEVLPLQGFAAVPGAPPEMLGAINLRGEIRMVCDLPRLLGLSPGQPLAHVLLVRRPEIGLAVDGIERLQRLSEDQLLPPPEGTARAVHAITEDGLLILSLSAILAHPTLQGDTR